MIKYLTSFILILSIAVCFSQNWYWERNDELLNPYNIHTTGTNTPFTGDFDDDGDYDMIVGCKGGVLQYYENIGNADSAIWRMDEDYFDGITIDTSLAPQPSLVDLDGDGVDELYLTFSDNVFYWPELGLKQYLNIGNQEDPDWVEGDFNIEELEYFNYRHEFIDFDLDGDLDLLLNTMEEGGIYYTNIGNNEENSFQQNDSIFNTLYYSGIGEYISYYFADVCGDSKYELFIILGLFDIDGMRVSLFENTGTTGSPIWQEIDINFEASYGLNFTFADLDNDSDKDMIFGHRYVPLYFNENIGNPDTLVLASEGDARWLGSLNLNMADNFVFVDYDADQDNDLIYFEYWQSIWDDYPNYGTATNEGTIFQPVLNNLDIFMNGEFLYYFSFHFSPGDINGDGYPELASSYPAFGYYKNQPDTGYNIQEAYSFNIEDLGYRRFPEMADFNNDGLTDIIYRNDSLRWLAYQNIGTSTEFNFVQNAVWLDDIDFPIKKFRAAYLNFDNKIDLIGTNEDNHLCGFINTGNGEDVSFIYIPGIFDSVQNLSIYYFDCVDIDGDFDDDVMFEENDYITVLENKTTTGIDDDTQPLPEQFKLTQNYPNPFNNSTTISFALDKQCEVELTLYDI